MARWYFGLAAGVLLTTLTVSVANAADLEKLEQCQCVWSSKDYDTEKGYYFDKFQFLPVWSYESHFGCVYTCKRPNGSLEQVDYAHTDWYTWWYKSTPHAAKYNICHQQIRKFTPRYRDGYGVLEYYQTEDYGPFSASTSKVKNIRIWAKARGCQ
jgi:hypothetical protein